MARREAFSWRGVKDDWYFDTVDTTGMTEDSLKGKPGSAEELGSPLPTEKWTPPSRAECERTLSRSGVDVSNMLTFDLETGPDMSRAHLFDLPPLPEQRRRKSVRLMPDPEQFFEKHSTVPEVKAELRKQSPCEEWLQLLEHYERDERPKCRKTMLDAINSFRKECLVEECAVADRLKKLCVTPMYALITAFGYAVGDEEPKGLIVSHPGREGDISEKECLELFWELAEDCSPLVGYNILAFDLVLIWMRSAVLGVTPSRQISTSKYSNNDVVDMYVRLGQHAGKCKSVCRAFGIEPPAGDVDGSDAWRLYLQDPEMLREYVKSDVFVERELFWFLSGGVWVWV